MFVSQAIEEIREEIHDITEEYSDKNLIRYINNAIQFVSGILIQVNYNMMVEEAIFHVGDALPVNFAKWAGRYPVKLTGGRIIFTDDAYASGMSMRYFSHKCNIISKTDKIPYASDAINLIVVQAACIFALNRNEFDVSQDTSIMQQLEQSLLAAIAKGGGAA